MHTPLPHRVRAHGRRSLVVVAMMLVALVSLARPAGAVGVPVDPVPVGVWPLQPTPEVVRAFDPPDTPLGRRSSRGGPRRHRSARSCTSRSPAGHLRRPGSPGRGRRGGRPRRPPAPRTSRSRQASASATCSPGAADRHARARPAPTASPSACLHWGWRRGATYLDPVAARRRRARSCCSRCGASPLTPFSSATALPHGRSTRPSAVPYAESWRPSMREPRRGSGAARAS